PCAGDARSRPFQGLLRARPSQSCRAACRRSRYDPQTGPHASGARGIHRPRARRDRAAHGRSEAARAARVHLEVCPAQTLEGASVVKAPFARTAAGRADLARLIDALPPERLPGAAATLGFEQTAYIATLGMQGGPEVP